MTEGPVRIDAWLSAARIFKSRTAAHDACVAGHVRINGEIVRASRLVRLDDVVSGTAPRGKIVLVVRALAEKRLGPPQARELYEDRSPPPPPRETLVATRERGAGRPTKADRRKIERFRGGF
ncbi:MAG TPA: RNA-binding S4 domain-containing protein [Polyangiaceae bacterium]|nr:RNA-binding S4 domain-containing protein [Polyangiaceae bacterium]